MKITLKRKIYTDKSTIGEIFVDGAFVCYSLEDTVRKAKIFGETAIPEGTYNVIVDYSPKFKMKTPFLLSVPNFTYIRIHIGNHPGNTQGCILVGMTPMENFVANSEDAFNLLFPIIERGFKQGKVTITIR
jgi:hypothetical protein